MLIKLNNKIKLSVISMTNYLQIDNYPVYYRTRPINWYGQELTPNLVPISKVIRYRYRSYVNQTQQVDHIEVFCAQ